MKVIPPPNYSTQELTLNSILLTSQELGELCERINHICGPVSIERKLSDDSVAIFDGIDDIINHAPSISVPFIIKSAGPTIDFSPFIVTVSYSRTDEVKAKTIFSTLRVHSNIFLNFPFITSMGMIVIVILAKATFERIGDAPPFPNLPNIYASDLLLFPFLIIMVGIQIYTFPAFRLKIRVRHLKRDTFFQRNKDKIILSISSLIAGSIATYIAYPMLFGSP